MSLYGCFVLYKCSMYKEDGQLCLFHLMFRLYYFWFDLYFHLIYINRARTSSAQYSTTFRFTTRRDRGWINASLILCSLERNLCVLGCWMGLVSSFDHRSTSHHIFRCRVRACAQFTLTRITLGDFISDAFKICTLKRFRFAAESINYIMNAMRCG